MAVTENHHRYARWNEQMFELWIVVVLLSAKIAVRSAVRQIRRKTNESNRISSVILFLYHHSFSLMVCICIHFESERAREQERTSFNSMWHIRRSKYRLLGTKRQHNIFKCILIIYAYWKSIWHWSTSKWICVTASMSTREPRERESERESTAVHIHRYEFYAMHVYVVRVHCACICGIWRQFISRFNYS